MSKEISNYFPRTSTVQVVENNVGNQVLNIGQESEDFTADTYSLNASNNLVITDNDLADSVSVGDMIVIDVDPGVATTVTVGEVDSVDGTVTILGDQSALNASIAGATTVTTSTVSVQARFEGVSEFTDGLVVVNDNGTTNPLELVTMETMTVDQYEDAMFTPDNDVLYLLTEDPITT